MLAIEQSELADLVRETRQRLELSQIKFAAKLGVSFQSVNRWENGRTKPLPVALKQI
jgi:DNA-binding transcriptional regulator YiaG